MDELRFRATRIDTTLPDVDAIGYDVALVVDDTPDHESYRAEVTGTFVATRDLRTLELDLVGNDVDEVRVGEQMARFAREGQRDDRKLIVTLPIAVAKGTTFTTSIKYRGQVISARGLNPQDFRTFGGLMLKAPNAEGRRIYTTLNWPSKGRRWLPLRDHPRDGAMVAMRATFPARYTVLANGTHQKTIDNPDGTRTWVYEAVTPMPTYDFHLAAYDGWVEKKFRASDGTTIATFTYAESSSQIDTVYQDLPAVFDFYKKTFGDYRWPTASFIEEPIFGGAMENATVVSMDETLFADPHSARQTAFHELAHHWSGNLVRIREWNDFWLSEGFADYLTLRAVANQDGPDAERTRWASYLHAVMAAERSRSMHPLRPEGPEVDVLSIFDAISYKKGALVLRMIERSVGIQTFSSFLRSWFHKHAFDAVTTDTFERELGAATGRDWGGFFRTLVRGSGHPEVRVSFEPTAPREVEVTVDQVQDAGPRSGFEFPLELEFASNDGRTERASVDVRGKHTTQKFRLTIDATRLRVDPQESLVGAVACAAIGDVCQKGYVCSSHVCLPQ